jgi:hypothetical protein
MAISTRAIFTPEIDDRRLGREVDSARDEMEELETIEPRLDTSRMQRDLDGGLQMPRGGGGGLGRSAAAGGGIGGGASLAGRALAGGSLTAGGAAAATAAIPVALAGIGALTLTKIEDQLAAATPALQQMDTMFATAMRNFQAPLGNALADALMPATNNLLEASIQFRKTAADEGLGQAFEDLQSGFVQPRIGEILEGPGALAPIGEVISDTMEDVRAGGELGSIIGGIFGGPRGGELGGALGAMMPIALSPLIRTFQTFANPLAELGDQFADFELDISDLQWTDFVPLLGWGSFVTALAWRTFVDGLNWSGFVDNLTWSGFVDALSWTRYVSALGWGVYVADLVWSTFIGDVDWGDYIPTIDWDSILFEGGGPLGEDGDIPPPGSEPGFPPPPTDDGGGGGGPSPTPDPQETIQDRIESGDSNPFTPRQDSGPINVGGGTVAEGRTDLIDSEGNIIGLQSGGIVTGPTTAAVGEGGAREAVLPLDSFLADLERSIRNAMGDAGGGAADAVDRKLDRLIRAVETRPIETSVEIDDAPIIRAVDARRTADDRRLVHK